MPVCTREGNCLHKHFTDYISVGSQFMLLQDSPVFDIVRITDIDGHIEYITFAKEYGSKKGQTHPTWRRSSVTVIQMKKISLETGA